MINLVTQCKRNSIPFLDELPTPAYVAECFNFIIDAVFGFSFKGEIRPPFDNVIEMMKAASIPVVSVDVPSGEESSLSFATCFFLSP